MATVPTVSGPTVQQAALPGAYQSVPQGLGNAGAANQQLLALAGKAAGAAVDFQQRQQNLNDIDAVFRSETALKDEYLQFERDELGKSGVNAKGAAERANQWWQDANTKFVEGLTERQAFAFKRTATQMRQASASTLMRHEQHQSNESLKESAQARIGTAVESAIIDPTPERLALSRKEIIESVTIAGNLAGYTPEIAKAKTQEALTLMHRGIVMRLADSDPDAAKAYYYTNKKEINGATAATLEKALERSGLLSESQKAADEIMPQFGNIADAMKHIETTYDGEKEKAIKAEVMDRFTRVTQSKNQMSQNAYETAMLATVQGQKVPTEVWAQMDDGHKATIIEKRKAEAKAREAEAQGKPIKTDFAAWDQLNRMVTADRAGFASLDLGRFADRISTQDRMEFANIQRDIRAGGGKSLDVVTLQQQIGTTVDQLKLTGAGNADKRGQLEHAIVTEIRAKQQEMGGKLNDEDRQKIIDKNIMQMAVPGFLWDSKKPAYQLTPEERAKAKIVVPDGDRKLIEEALKAKGRPVNEDAVLKLFKQSKGIQ